MISTLNEDVYKLKESLERQLTIPFSSHRTVQCTYLTCSSLSIFIYPNETVRREQVLGRAIHIDEDILHTKFDIILARTKSLLNTSKRVYGRHTVVARIDKKAAILFLQENHLQEALPGKYRYGLYADGELIAVAVFSGGRSMREQARGYRSFELLRFCCKIGFNVVGGISKLIKAFSNDFDPGDIMTYTDRDWTTDSSLSKIGFQETAILPPIRFWITESERFHVKDENSLEHIRTQYPDGFLKENSGSTKMILFIK